jgi:hypothetical protein
MAEQNRPTLQTALQALAQYDPPAEVWGQIEQQLDQHSAESSLHQAVEQLPMYEPPVAAWGQIEAALTEDRSEQTLQNALQELPEYEPPKQLWTNIQQSIGQEASLYAALEKLPEYTPPAQVWEAIDREIQQPKRRRIVRMRNWMARAAAVAALIVGTWYFWPRDYAAIQAAYIHETEQAGGAWTATTDWSTDEAAIQQAVSTFKQDPLAQNQDNYEQLLEEWKELNEAKSEIADIMDRYGKDARLIRQMSEIERERSSVLRKMVREI